MAQSDKISAQDAVVITGAASGIGKAAALYLDSLGFRVFAGVRQEADAELLKQESSGRIMPLIIDVNDTSSIDLALDVVKREVGEAGLAGLVNNAGIVVGGPLEFLRIDEFRQQIEVNVIGQVAVTQAFIPLIRKAVGRIIFMSSISGRVSSPFLAAYCASKFALEAAADALRIELLPWGISVSIIEPGSVATPIWKKSIAAAENRFRQFPQSALELYGRAFEAVHRAAERSAQRAIPPSRVVKKIAHALMARRPRTRYVIGYDAWIRIILQSVLPTRLFDRIVASYLGLRKMHRT